LPKGYTLPGTEGAAPVARVSDSNRAVEKRRRKEAREQRKRARKR
jgi:hypothetical protein